MNPVHIDSETTWTPIRDGAFMGIGDGYSVTIVHTRWALVVDGHEYRGEEPNEADAVTEARDIRRLVMGC